MAIIKSTEVLKRIKSGEKKNIPPPFFFFLPHCLNWDPSSNLIPLLDVRLQHGSQIFRLN